MVPGYIYSAGVSIAIYHSCNELIYNKIGRGYECWHPYFMNVHWSTNCIGNAFCDMSFKEYMELRNKPETGLTNPFYVKRGIHRYELWLKKAIKRVQRAREITKKTLTSTIIQRKWVEYMYLPDGMTAKQLENIINYYRL
ncbi:35356_t:CDS:1, partial [Gigaspora margarita]